MPSIFNLRNTAIYYRPALPVANDAVKFDLLPYVWSAYEHPSDAVWPAYDDDCGAMAIATLGFLWEQAGLNRFRTGIGLPLIINTYLDSREC